MQTFLEHSGTKLFLICALFFAPFAQPEAMGAETESGYRNLAAEPIIADLRESSGKESPKVPMPETGLSDTWKYVISGLVMFFFLGLALFIQIRAEREK